MNTKKMLALAIFSSGMLMNTLCCASIIVIDDFSQHQNSSPDNVANGITSSTTNTERTISHNLLSLNPTNPGTADVAEGKLNIRNTSTEDSIFKVSWLIKDGLLAETTNAKLSFAVFETNKLITDLKFLFNNTELASFHIDENTKTDSLAFGITPTQLRTVNNGGTLALEINSAPGANLSLDNVEFVAENRATNVPEPTLMGLVGLSLTGLGLLRKKKTD